MNVRQLLLFLPVLLAYVAILSRATSNDLATIDLDDAVGAPRHDGHDHKSCAICLRDMVPAQDEGDTIQLLNQCKHQDHFHEKCLKRWLGSKNTCPLCRKAARIRNDPLLPKSTTKWSLGDEATLFDGIQLPESFTEWFSPEMRAWIDYLRNGYMDNLESARYHVRDSWTLENTKFHVYRTAELVIAQQRYVRNLVGFFDMPTLGFGSAEEFHNHFDRARFRTSSIQTADVWSMVQKLRKLCAMYNNKIQVADVELRKAMNLIDAEAAAGQHDGYAFIRNFQLTKGIRMVVDRDLLPVGDEITRAATKVIIACFNLDKALR